MSYYKIEYPTSISPEMLDKDLSNGRYRIQQKMITTDYVNEYSDEETAIWIRYDLQKIIPNKTTRRIRNKNNLFDVSFGKFLISEEVESLFGDYKSIIDFDTTETAKEYLQEDKESNVFNTEMVLVKQNNSLIAIGYFDTGKESMAAILNIYDPAFRNYSLGKYLILLEIEYAKKKSLSYFYPGYISPQNMKYNYKLFVDKNAIELFDRINGKWEPYSDNLVEILDKIIRTRSKLIL